MISLGRIKCTIANAWYQYMHAVEQDGRQTLSEPIPMSCTFVLKETHPARIRRSSYFKMDCNIVNSEKIATKIEELWQSFQMEGQDPRINWDLA